MTLDEVLTKLAAPFPEEDVDWLPRDGTRINGRVMLVPALKVEAIRRRFDEVLGDSWKEDAYENGLGCHCGITVSIDGHYSNRFSWDRDAATALRKAAAGFRVGTDVLLYQGKYAPIWEDSDERTPV